MNIQYEKHFYESNEIYNEDALKGIQELYQQRREFVDAIITDPPYVISQKHNFSEKYRLCKTGLDFGEWDYNFNYLGWIAPAVRLLKKGGSIITFCDWKKLSYIADELERNNCEVKQVLIWKKSNPWPRNTGRLYVSSCEYAIWAIKKGKKWTFNRQRQSFENAVFEYPKVHHSHRIHTTQKPIKLMEEIINIHTNSADIVLDPFAGSGTTLVACQNLNRKYLGFEKDENYYAKAKERLYANVENKDYKILMNQ